MVVIEDGATLTIEKDVVVSFQINPDQPFEAPGIEVVDGRLVANGTKNKPIVLTSFDDGFKLLFEDDSRVSFLRFVTLENGGFIPTAEGSGDFVPQDPVLTVYNGNVHMENSKFINSRFDEIVDTSENIYDDDGNPIFRKRLEVINSNFSNQEAVSTQLNCWAYDESTDEDYVDQACLKGVYLKDNWYNHAFGPTTDDDRDNEIEKGYNASGQFFLDSWRTTEEIINPVLVVPGITGSAEVDGVWKMDPILHTYDDLLESLEENGYTKNKNLFDLPYDWRKSNEMTAQNLQTKIAKIVSESKIFKVDVVAHSMGGLVVRSYIESDEYANNVGELITLGTPHHGSPKGYLTWEAGEFGINIDDYLAQHHFDMEALHNHYTNTFDYIQERILSVRDLLPDYDYLFDVAQSATRSYADGYPQNTFLENLNDSDNVEKLKKINFTNIIGILDGNDQSTISKIRVVNSTVEDRWADGMPENFYDGGTDQGLGYDKGDGTVPEASAEDIVSDKLIKINSKHSDIPTLAQCLVIEELLASGECVYVDKYRVPNVMLFNVFSPIDIQIIAPDGKRVGKDFVTGDILNEIEGAYYSGFETENEFLSIPNPLDGEYQILTQGTGEGDFNVEATKIFEQSDGSTQESVVAFTGTAIQDVENSFVAEVFGETVVNPDAPVEDVVDDVSGDEDNDSEVIVEEETVDDVVADETTNDSKHEKKSHKDKKKSSKKDDEEIKIENMSEQTVIVSHSEDKDETDSEDSLGKLKDGLGKLATDIDKKKIDHEQDVIKKNSQAGSKSGKIVAEIFASIAGIFVARKGLLLFLSRI